MKKLFHISELYIQKQLTQIKYILGKHKEDVCIAYQSHWYVVVACINQDVARHIQAKLRCNHLYGDVWEYEIRPGRQFKERHYLRIKFDRSKL